MVETDQKLNIDSDIQDKHFDIDLEAMAWARLLYSAYTKKKQLLSSKQEQNEV